MGEERKDNDWKQVMQLRSVQAAQQLAKRLSENGKPGFLDGDSPQNLGRKTLGKVREDVGRLISDEVSIRVGKLVGRKDRMLADELARARHEAQSR